MKRQQMTPGAIVEINIDNEYYVYAQILPTNNLVFFDYRTKEPLRKDFRVLEEAKPLFFMCKNAERRFKHAGKRTRL